MQTKRFSREFWQLAGSFALGVGLVALGLLGLLTLSLILPAGRAHAHPHPHDLDGSGERREGKAFHWAGPVGRGKTLEVSGIHGNIDVQLTSGSQVVVDAKKSGRRSDPESVEIEVSEHDRGVSICARYPRPDGGTNDCGDRQEVRDNDVAVHFQIKVPAGVNLVVKTVNGGIEAEGLRGDVEATTVNGSVTVSTSGVASAQTVNGSVLARLGRLDDDLDFTTVNGRVRVVLPRAIDASVRARTMHGSIASDFPLSKVERWGNRRMTGTLGRGGPQIRIETVNGSIELRSDEGRFAGDRAFERDDDDDRHDHDHDDVDDADDRDDEDDDPRH